MFRDGEEKALGEIITSSTRSTIDKNAAPWGVQWRFRRVSEINKLYDKTQTMKLNTQTSKAHRQWVLRDD